MVKKLIVMIIIRNIYLFFNTLFFYLMNLYLEIIAVILNLIYLILLIKEHITCWFFGITGSIISIYLFYSIGLYSESILYIYYVVIGIYGYRLWKKKNNSEYNLKIQTLNPKTHLLIIISGILLAIITGHFFKSYTDAVNPYLDAFTTIFSFIASFLEARKILSSWLFWIIINTTTILLYYQQNLDYYLLLTIIYIGFSFIGYIDWKKKHQITKANNI